MAFVVFIFCKLPLNCNRFVRDRMQLKVVRQEVGWKKRPILRK